MQLKSRLLKHYIGYNIRLTRDDCEDAVIPDREQMTIYINTAKLQNLTYADYLFAVKGLFVTYVVDRLDFTRRIYIESQWRAEVLFVALKAIILLLITHVASYIPNLIICMLIDIPCFTFSFMLLRRIDKMECPVSFPEERF